MVKLRCLDDYAAWELAIDIKLHTFASKHKANTYSPELTHSDYKFPFQDNHHWNL